MTPVAVWGYDQNETMWRSPGRTPVLVTPEVTEPPPDTSFIYRDRSNTGLTLVGASTGDLTINTATTISAAGTYDGVHFTTNGTLVISGSNVVLDSCKVNGVVRINNPATNVHLINCDIGALVFQSCVDSFADYCYWTNGITGQDGVKVESYYSMATNNGVRYSYVGNSLTDANSHYDGFQSGGFQGFELYNVTLDGGLGGLNDDHNAQVFTQNRSDIGGGRGMINDDLLVQGCHIRSRGFFTLLLTGTNEVFKDNTFYPSGTYESGVFHTSSSSVITSLNNKWSDGRTAIPDGTINT